MSKGGSHGIPQKSEDAGATTPLAGTGVPSSAETPWENPGLSLSQCRKRSLRKGSQAAKHLHLVRTIPAGKTPTFPQSNLGNDQFCQHWGGRESSWAKRNLPPGRPRALELQGDALAGPHSLLSKAGALCTVQECH